MSVYVQFQFGVCGGGTRGSLRRQKSYDLRRLYIAACFVEWRGFGCQDASKLPPLEKPKTVTFVSRDLAGVFDLIRMVSFRGGGNSNIFYFHPYLGKISILTNIFQMGWNHQLVTSFCLMFSMRTINMSFTIRYVVIVNCWAPVERNKARWFVIS